MIRRNYHYAPLPVNSFGLFEQGDTSARAHLSKRLLQILIVAGCLVLGIRLATRQPRLHLEDGVGGKVEDDSDPEGPLGVPPSQVIEEENASSPLDSKEKKESEEDEGEEEDDDTEKALHPRLFHKNRKARGIYHYETNKELNARLNEWTAQLRRMQLAARGSYLTVTGFPMQEFGLGSGLLARSGIVVESGTIIIPIHYVPNSIKEPEMLERRMHSSCRVSFATTGNSRQEEEEEEEKKERSHPVSPTLGCSCVYTERMPPRFAQQGSASVVCTYNSKQAPKGVPAAILFSALRIPLERPVRLQPTSRSTNPSLAVCVQHTLFGNLERKYFDAFLQHYRDAGATDIHFYTESLALVDRILPHEGKNKNYPRVWVHDGALPPHKWWGEGHKERAPRLFTHSDSEAKLVMDPSTPPLWSEITQQYFIATDCLARVKAAGTDWLLVVDLDEFVVPSRDKPSHSSGDDAPPAWSLVQRVAEEKDKLSQQRTQGGDAKSSTPTSFDLVWLDSIKMDSSTCAEGTDEESDFREAVVWGQLDLGQYRGRRKALLRMERMSTRAVAYKTDWRVHDVILKKGMVYTTTRAVHIHHYRGVFFKRCTAMAPIDSSRLPHWVLHHPQRDCGGYPREKGGPGVSKKREIGAV